MLGESSYWQDFWQNANNNFQNKIYGNFKTYFFLNLYLWMFLVKQVTSKNYSFCGLSLWHLHWIFGLYSASKLHNFCIVEIWKYLRICWTLRGLIEFLILNFEGHSTVRCSWIEDSSSRRLQIFSLSSVTKVKPEWPDKMSNS